MWKLCEICILLSLKFYLLEHSHTHSFIYCLAVSHYNGDLGDWNSDHMAAKAKNLYYLAL